MTSCSLRRIACVILCLAVSVASARKASAQDVLNDKSYWRVYVTWKTPTLVTPDGKLKPLYNPKTGKPLPVVRSAPPPKDWMAPDFGDTSWGKVRGVFHIGPGYRGVLSTVGGRTELQGIYLRGKFHVKNPKQVMLLKLHLRYVGGAVVYVNGAELQRGHLSALSPSKGSKGKLGPDVLADPYTDRIYLRPDGKLLHELTDRKMDHVSNPKWENRFRDGMVVWIPVNLKSNEFLL